MLTPSLSSALCVPAPPPKTSAPPPPLMQAPPPFIALPAKKEADRSVAAPLPTARRPSRIADVSTGHRVANA
eukprot:3693718-Rhodomonas_salina.2